MSAPSLSEGVRRSSQLPFYAQLMQALKEDFRHADPHTALPSEQTLQDLFRVSRTVVRQALRELSYEGFVYREKGRGTFIAPPKVTQGQFQGIEGFAAEMARHGHESSTVVLEQKVRRAPGHIAERLELALDAPVISLRRLRKLGSRPFMVAHNWLPLELFPGLQSADLTNRSLYKLLEDDYGISFVGGARVFEAVAASAELAPMLNLEAGSPVMRVELVNRLGNGRVGEHSVAHHRGDRARFEFQVASG